MNQKGLPLRSFLAESGQTQVLILAGIVILIAVAGGIFFLGRVTLPRQDSSGQAAPKPQPQNVAAPSPQPSPLSTEASAKVEDPTANWKTYANSKYSFEFKYPPTWSVIESKTPGNPYLAFISLGPTESIQSGGMIAVTVRNQTENDYIAVFTKEGFQIAQRIDIQLGTNKASHYKLNKTLESGEKSEQEIAIAMKNGVLYEINGGSNLREQNKNIFDQILSTFRFIQ